jgi:hypothetical protein
MTSGTQPIDALTATLTLWALSTAMPDAVASHLEIVVLDGHSLTFEEAAEQLATRPKPLRCNGADVGGVLTVSCAEFLNEEGESWIGAMDYTIHESTAVLRKVFGGDSARLAVESRGPALTITLEAWAHWRRDYELPRVGFAISPSGQRSGEGIAATVEFWTVAEPPVKEN